MHAGRQAGIQFKAKQWTKTKKKQTHSYINKDERNTKRRSGEGGVFIYNAQDVENNERRIAAVAARSGYELVKSVSPASFSFFFSWHFRSEFSRHWRAYFFCRHLTKQVQYIHTHTLYRANDRHSWARTIARTVYAMNGSFHSLLPPVVLVLTSSTLM